MEVRPAINDPVVLRDHADRKFRSRVEGLEDGLIFVAWPFDVPATEVFDPGVELAVTWRTARGLAVLPTTLVDAHVEGRHRLWSMAVTGEGWVEQRRKFVRVPASGAVALTPRGDDATVDPTTGELLDVSEAALRCSLVLTAADSAVPESSDVTASFRLGDRDFAIPARTGLATRPAGRTELVVVFDEPVVVADELRKQIFAEQLRIRRATPGVS